MKNLIYPQIPTKRHRLLILLLVPLIGACLEPVASDFEKEPHALKADEIQWVLQVQQEADLNFIRFYSFWTEDTVAARRSRPMFEVIIPAVLSDLKRGRLQAYSPDTEGKKMHLHELNQRMEHVGSSWQDVSALLSIAHIIERGASSPDGFNGNMTYLCLVWHDPQSRLPSKTVARVKIEDLNYPLVLEGKKMTVKQYLQSRQYYFFPLRVHSRERSYDIRRLEEGFYLREKILAGQWENISWIGGALNLSEKQAMSGVTEKIAAFEGLYLCDGRNPADEKRQFYIAARHDRAEVEWESGFREILYMSGEQTLFSSDGNLYQLAPDEEGAQVSVRVGGGQEARLAKKITPD